MGDSETGKMGIVGETDSGNMGEERERKQRLHFHVLVTMISRINDQLSSAGNSSHRHIPLAIHILSFATRGVIIYDGTDIVIIIRELNVILLLNMADLCRK